MNMWWILVTALLDKRKQKIVTIAFTIGLISVASGIVIILDSVKVNH